MASKLRLNEKNIVYFRGDRWWAERGLIHVENASTGDYKTLTVKTCLIHLRGLHDMVGNSRQDDGFHSPEEVAEHQRYIDAMIGVCQRAREQGMPSDDSAVRAVRRSRRTVVTPGGHAIF